MRAVPLLALLAVLLVPVPASAVDEYISYPGRIPYLHDFQTPIIEPGKTGDYGFYVTNRYGAPMGNISLSIEIFRFTTTERSVPAKDIAYPPTIVPSPEFQSRTQLRTVLSRPVLGTNETWAAGLRIETATATDEGVYLVRHALDFDYNGTHHRMPSRSHISDADWRAAGATGQNFTGKVNLTYLNISGVLPDSSFTVQSPRALWPLALLIVLAAVFAFMAFAVYVVEGPGGKRYPRLQKGLYRWTGKLQKYRGLAEEEVGKVRRKVNVSKLDDKR